MMASIWERIRALGLAQGFWALADQGVVSLGTFLMSILLARHLPPAQYGIYALIFGAIIFLNGIHRSLVTYPLSIDGAGIDSSGLGRLAGTSLAFTVVLGLPLSAAVIIASYAAGAPAAAPWATATLLCWQFQETARRGLMAHLRHRDAIWGDIVSYLGQALVAWIVLQSGQLTLDSALITIALTSAMGGVIQALQIGLRTVDRAEMRRLVTRFWRLGSWMALGVLASFLWIQIFPWTLAFFHDTSEAAKFQAVINILGVSHPVMFGISNLIMPAAAGARLSGGVAEAQRVSARYALQGGALLVPFFLVLLIWPTTALSIFYGPDSPYAALVIPLRMLVITYIFMYAVQILGALLNGLERSSTVFLTQLVSILPAIAVGIPLSAQAGVAGACIGFCLCYFVGACANGLVTLRLDDAVKRHVPA